MDTEFILITPPMQYCTGTCPVTFLFSTVQLSVENKNGFLIHVYTDTYHSSEAGLLIPLIDLTRATQEE